MTWIKYMSRCHEYRKYNNNVSSILVPLSTRRIKVLGYFSFFFFLIYLRFKITSKLSPFFYFLFSWIHPILIPLIHPSIWSSICAHTLYFHISWQSWHDVKYYLHVGAGKEGWPSLQAEFIQIFAHSPLCYFLIFFVFFERPS